MPGRSKRATLAARSKAPRRLLWDNNWKLTEHLGVQSFSGAQLPNLTSFPAFTQPIVRLDLDRMDDDDNRLFGITAQIAWAPKPSYQLTLRTPLYAIKN